MNLTADDEKYLLQAESIRLRLAKPRQSRFRVVAVVTYRTATGSIGVCVGANDEPCYIGGSICAERSALLQLRLLDAGQVCGIYIVSDAEFPIPPGMLCREFMISSPHICPEMPIIMASKGFKSREESYAQVRKIRLKELYPFPGIFARETIESCIEYHKSVQQGKVDIVQPEEGSAEHSVWNAAKAAAQLDSKIDLHPMQYGAAAMCSDGKLFVGYQKKAIEYGCTLCAVTQLAQAVEEHIQSKKVDLALLAQVDNMGICHAPFAAARSWLAEYGHGSCKVLIHETEDAAIRLKQVSVDDLCPCKDLPIFKNAN